MVTVQNVAEALDQLMPGDARTKTNDQGKTHTTTPYHRFMVWFLGWVLSSWRYYGASSSGFHPDFR